MSKPIAQMTVEDVCAWLTANKLEKHAPVFIENDINGPTLVQLDKATLAEIGITKQLDQAKIIGAIDVLKAAGALGGSGSSVKVDAKASPSPSPSSSASPAASPEAKFAIIHLAPNTPEFQEAEDRFKLALNNQISCYTKDRVLKGLRPVTFRVVDAWRVQNHELAARFEESKVRMTKLGRSEAEMRVRRGFHGTSAKNIEAIARNGLLRIGHPLNPSKSTDAGYFGDPKQGVNVACNPDYSLKYSNGLEPLSPGEEVKLLMFDVRPGKSKHITEMNLGLPQTPGFDSHSSANFLEFFLFNEDQCLPTHILMVRAFENRRVDTDDEKADLVGLHSQLASSHSKPAPPASVPVPASATPSASPVSASVVVTHASSKPAPVSVAPEPVVVSTHAVVSPAPVIFPVQKPEAKTPAASVTPAPSVPVTSAVAATKPPAPVPQPEVKASSPAAVFTTAKPGAQPKLLLSFAGYGPGPGQFKSDIEGLAISPDNRVWVSSKPRVQVFSDDGKFLFAAAEEKFVGPRCIAFDSGTQEAFIADNSENCVVVCRLDGNFVRKFGSYGSGKGKLHMPSGVAMDRKQGLVFVSEFGNDRVSVFKRDGSFVRVIGAKGSGDGELNGPQGVCLTAAGELAVVDCNQRVQVFDVSGKFLRKFGVGQFKSPWGICTDSAGNFLVADYPSFAGWLFIFDANGALITRLETDSSACKVGGVYSVCTDKDNRIFVGGKSYHVHVLGFESSTSASAAPAPSALVTAAKSPAAVAPASASGKGGDPLAAYWSPWPGSDGAWLSSTSFTCKTSTFDLVGPNKWKETRTSGGHSFFTQWKHY